MEITPTLICFIKNSLKNLGNYNLYAVIYFYKKQVFRSVCRSVALGNY